MSKNSLTGSSPCIERLGQSRNSKDIWQQSNHGRPVKRRKRKLVEVGEECVCVCAWGSHRKWEKEERWGRRREGTISPETNVVHIKASQ